MLTASTSICSRFLRQLLFLIYSGSLLAPSVGVVELPAISTGRVVVSIGARVVLARGNRARQIIAVQACLGCLDIRIFIES